MISRAGQRMCLEELPHQHSRINSMRGGTQDRYAYIDHKRVSSAMKLKDGNRPTAATATGDWIEGTGNRGKLCLSVHPWGDRKTVRVAPEGAINSLPGKIQETFKESALYFDHNTLDR